MAVLAITKKEVELEENGSLPSRNGLEIKNMTLCGQRIKNNASGIRYFHRSSLVKYLNWLIIFRANQVKFKSR